jgi:hypothetical protein
MSHLPAERLAALADHSHCPDLEPSPTERAHLAICASCTREVSAYARLVAESRRESERRVEPLAAWAGIAAGLRAEGLIADGESRVANRESGRMNESAEREAPSVAIHPRSTRRSALPSLRWAGRIAAGLMFAVAGAVAGRATAGGSIAGTGANTRADTVHDTVHDTIVATAAAPQRADPPVAQQTFGGTMARAVSYGVDTAARFVSTADALTALASAERQYERAAAFLVEHDSSSQPTDSSQLYKARLAALDNVMAATREALYDAPHDPLINRYYLATMGAREATLRQLGTSLPRGERISRY